MTITSRPCSRCLLAIPLMGACCLMLPITAACRQSGPEVVPVKGTIKRGGGLWPKPGVLYFTPESPSPGLPVRPATGTFDTEGNVTVTTFANGDGLIPGKYRIAVECWETPPRMGQLSPPKSYVPDRYSSPASSGLSVTVMAGHSSVPLDLDIPMPSTDAASNPLH